MQPDIKQGLLQGRTCKDNAELTRIGSMAKKANEQDLPLMFSIWRLLGNFGR